MPELKLAKLPERSPLKLTITVGPDLHGALRDYADIYAATYGQQEKIEDLIAFMLQQFIEGDRGFAKAKKAKQPLQGWPPTRCCTAVRRK